MKAPTIEKTRHGFMAFVAAMKDDGHTPENVRAVLRELVAMANGVGGTDGR